jgi:hypothetical protein
MPLTERAFRGNCFVVLAVASFPGSVQSTLSLDRLSAFADERSTNQQAALIAQNAIFP